MATIACAHRAAKILNPNDDEDVKMALKALYNSSPKRQRQAAHPSVWGSSLTND
jgi:hypothetical protein